jgi:DNA polymerase-3 subunit delta
MARLNEQDLNCRLRKTAFHRYFIYGEEGYLKQFYVNKLTDILVDKTFRDFNLHSFNGKKNSA